MLKHPCYSEVSYFYLAILGHENILGLQISVQDLPIMNVLDSESHLHEPV